MAARMAITTMTTRSSTMVKALVGWDLVITLSLSLALDLRLKLRLGQ
jgi:hypothetical protein